MATRLQPNGIWDSGAGIVPDLAQSVAEGFALFHPGYAPRAHANDGLFAQVLLDGG